jgi:hypothetical protein
MTFNVTMRFHVKYNDRRYQPDDPPSDVFEWGECESETEARATFLAAHPNAYIVKEERIG